MKAWLAGIVLLIGALIAAKQLNGNDYTIAKKFAEAGNYQAFYAEIKEDVAKGDEGAIDLVMLYFLKAVYDGDVEEVKYYLDHNAKFINQQDKDGDRAMDIAVLLTKKHQIDMINTLLLYHPELHYRRTKPENLTFTEELFWFMPKISPSKEMVALLIDHGMDVNNYGKPDMHDNCIPPLAVSYLHNDYELFELLLPNSKNINPVYKLNKNNATLVEKIAFSYIAEIQKAGTKLEHPADEKLWSVIRSEKYRTLHQNNMRYVQALLRHRLIDRTSEKELKKLFVFYASTGEAGGTKLFVEHGICQKYPALCTQGIRAARVNRFDEIEKIIGGQ